MVVAIGWMVARALLTFAADIEGQEDAVANLEVFVLHCRSNCAHGTSTLVTENRRKLDQREQSLLEDNILFKWV